MVVGLGEARFAELKDSVTEEDASCGDFFGLEVEGERQDGRVESNLADLDENSVPNVFEHAIVVTLLNDVRKEHLFQVAVPVV